jgi:hypothetical protein
MSGARVVRVDEDGRAASYRDLSGRSPLGGGSTVPVGSGFRADGSLLLTVNMGLDQPWRYARDHVARLAIGPTRDLADMRSEVPAGARTVGVYVMAGPLPGVRVVELAGIGPGPFAGVPGH